MSDGEIEKRGFTSMSASDAAMMISSLGDTNLVVSMFDSLGWTFTDEIREVLKLVRQNTNLPAKLNAIKYLREILREAAETSGMIANVTRTIPGHDGESTTFHARGIVDALHPEKRKQVDSTMKGNEDERREGDGQEPDRGCNPEDGQETPAESGDCERTNDSRDTPAPGDSGERGGENAGGDGEVWGSGTDSYDAPTTEEGGSGEDVCVKSNGPCVQHNPPTCELRLYPGVTGVPPDSGISGSTENSGEGAETAS